MVRVRIQTNKLSREDIHREKQDQPAQGGKYRLDMVMSAGRPTINMLSEVQMDQERDLAMVYVFLF